MHDLYRAGGVALRLPQGVDGGGVRQRRGVARAAGTAGPGRVGWRRLARLGCAWTPEDNRVDRRLRRVEEPTRRAKRDKVAGVHDVRPLPVALAVEAKVAWAARRDDRTEDDRRHRAIGRVDFTLAENVPLRSPHVCGAGLGAGAPD